MKEVEKEKLWKAKRKGRESSDKNGKKWSNEKNAIQKKRGNEMRDIKWEELSGES